MIARLRRAWRPTVAAVAVLVLGLGYHVGWFSATREWQSATGWNRVPASERPGAALPATLAPESADIRWLGHSGFRMAWGGSTVLLDPNLGSWCTISRRLLEPAVPADALGPIDAVLISHAHFDHLDLPTLRAVGNIGTVVLPRGSEHVLTGAGISAGRVQPLIAGERTRVGELEIDAVPAAHNSSRLHPFHGRARAQGYVIRHGGRAIYFASDTGLANDFEAIRRADHPDVAILPIGAFSPRFPMRYYHLSPEEAVAVGVRLGVERVIPCHFGTFVLSLDRPDQALPRFARAAAAAGLAWEMPRLLTPDAVAADHARGLDVAGGTR